MRIVTVLITAALLGGCSRQYPEGTYNPPPHGQENYEVVAETPYQQIVKIVDLESGVVCYTVRNGSNGASGISCVKEN